jgi:uncharacterized Ntn-hydrolase superfamily protein
LTFTILARDDPTGMLGVALGSGRPLTEAVHIEHGAGVGIAIAQGLPRTELPRQALAELAAGTRLETVASKLLGDDPERDERQLLLIEARGLTAGFTGRHTGAAFGQIEGLDHLTAGCGMASANVIGAMSLSFERSGGDPFWERLLLALESGTRAGGDAGGTTSAKLLVIATEPEPVVSLSVEDHEDPILGLRRLLAARPDPGIV